jgi:putative nucleotidyltransferase with HDIG domain
MIARVDALPSPSVVVQKLNECILRPDANVSDVATIAATDAAITAKLLQLANSSFFGIARPVTDVEDAITLIGISTVRDLATGSKLYDVPTTDAGPMDISELETHTNEVAHIARALCSNTDIAREAFCAGVLHDIGELVLAIGFPDEEAEIRRRMTTGEDRCSLENELFDVTHAAIGAHLLRLWGLPASIVEAVAWHHDAPQHEPWELNTLHATYLAELISKHGTDISSLVPAGYLERLGCQPLPALTGKEFT